MSDEPDPALASTPVHRSTTRGCATVYPDFAALPGDVLELLDAAGATDFQSSAAWFINFTRHVDLPGQTPQLHVWREDGLAVAALPLLRHGSQISSLSNYYSTRYAPLLKTGADTPQAAGWLAALLAPVLSAAGAPYRLRVEPLAAGSCAERALHAALRVNGCAVFEYPAFANWVLPVDGDWPSYLAARDGRLRTTLSRMGKRFAARGGRLQLLCGGPELDRGIAAYLAVYAASWKQPEPHPRFMPGLIRAAAQAGVLRMGLAWLGDQPVAAQIWITTGGRADIYKLAHDERHKETSPGSLLTAMLMQHAFEVDRVRVVDYLSGDDAYKQLWMSEVHQRCGLLAFRLKHPLGLVGAARETLSMARKRLRPAPNRNTTRP